MSANQYKTVGQILKEIDERARLEKERMAKKNQADWDNFIHHIENIITRDDQPTKK